MWLRGCSLDDHEAVSRQANPWTYITQDDAIKACQNIGAHLMTNAEWMAIARNIEKVDENWHSEVLKKENGEYTTGISYGGDGLETGKGPEEENHFLSKLTNGQEYIIFRNASEWVDDR